MINAVACIMCAAMAMVPPFELVQRINAVLAIANLLAFINSRTKRQL